VEGTAIPQALFSMLQALPNTALWNRLQRRKGVCWNEEGHPPDNAYQLSPLRGTGPRVRELLELYEPERYLKFIGIS